MADELEDMLVRAILRKAPSVKPDEAADIAIYFRTMLNNDRRVIVNHICTKLTLLHAKPTAAAAVMEIMENYDG